MVVMFARGCYSRGCTCCERCFYSTGVTCCQGVCRKCFYSRGGTFCQGGWLRVVRERGKAAVRATRLLLDRRDKCRRALHAFKNNVVVLLRVWCSPHLFHLLVGGLTHGLPAARQHQLQDTRWRRGAVEHALPKVGRHLDAERVNSWESSRDGEDIFRQARALPNGSRRWWRHRGGGNGRCRTQRSSIISSVLLLFVGLGRSALVCRCEGRKGGPRRCKSWFLGEADFLRAFSRLFLERARQFFLHFGRRSLYRVLYMYI